LRLTFTVPTKTQASAAPFMPSCPPFRINCPRASAQHACISILIIAIRSYCRQAEGLDMAAREADCDDWLPRMDCLREELRGERQGTDGFEHCCKACFATRVFRRRGIWQSQVELFKLPRASHRLSCQLQRTKNTPVRSHLLGLDFNAHFRVARHFNKDLTGNIPVKLC
jgi:hypothetical protein